MAYDDRESPEERLRAALREVERYRAVAEACGRRRLREAEESSQLIARIRETERALELANAELERRVEARTADLSAANAELRAEVVERARAEEARARLERQAQAQQTLESLGVLASGIAHDFNNLLSSILGNTSLLLSGSHLTGDELEAVRDIDEAGRRAAELCQQMLAYSGRGRFVVERVELSSLVQGLVQLLRSSLVKRATLSVSLASGLPVLWVDATQVRQVVMNLLLNAAEAIGPAGGTLTVSTGAVDVDAGRLSAALVGVSAQPGSYVWVEVADTGCGMTETVQERLFEPFFTTKPTGRGLGLSAVLGIVRGLEGAIELDSAPGRGTVFRVLLPVSEEEPAAPPSVKPDKAAWTTTGVALVVDDEAAVRRIGRRLLASLGFEVLVAVDGREAIAIFTEHHPSVRVVLLDFTMPGLDGAETLRELRRIRPDVRVIVATGYAECEVAPSFPEQPPDALLQKPYRLDHLRELVQRVLERPPA